MCAHGSWIAIGAVIWPAGVVGPVRSPAVGTALRLRWLTVVASGLVGLAWPAGVFGRAAGMTSARDSLY